MQIRLARKSDGSTVLSCRRADGTSTWQRRDGEFFALHDLEHFAIETVLGLQRGFYGLLASGWNITDFGTPWPRGPIPEEAFDEAFLAESLAGALDGERATGQRMTATEFNETLASKLAEFGRAPVRVVTEEELGRVRVRFAELRREWEALPVGGEMGLEFGE